MIQKNWLKLRIYKSNKNNLCFYHSFINQNFNIVFIKWVEKVAFFKNCFQNIDRKK